MKIIVEIDDDDRFDPDARTTPWTLRVMAGASGDEAIEVAGEASMIGGAIPDMLRELADLWPARAPHHAELVTLDLEVTAVYPDGGRVVTPAYEVIVPAPDPERPLAEQLLPHLEMFPNRRGVPGVKNWILIERSSDPALVGFLFDVS